MKMNLSGTTFETLSLYLSYSNRLLNCDKPLYLLLYNQNALINYLDRYCYQYDLLLPVWACSLILTILTQCFLKCLFRCFTKVIGVSVNEPR